MRKISAEQIRQDWEAMRIQVKTSAIYRQASSSSCATIGLYCGPDKSVGLVIHSNFPLTRNFNYSNLKIDKRKVNSLSWEIVLSLVNPELETPFSILCAQITNGLAENKSIDGGTYLATQLSRWSNLMRKSPTLGQEQERGLFGELYLLQKAVSHVGEAKALSSWVGPESAPQDFLFEQGAVEVKSLYDKAGEVKISSLDQLDPAGESLYLVLVGLSQDETGSTLKDKVAEVGKLFKDFPELMTVFEEKLFESGYCEDLGKVGTSIKYSVVSSEWYDASSEDFPALRRHSINPAILKAGYTLAVSSIGLFKTGAQL